MTKYEPPLKVGDKVTVNASAKDPSCTRRGEMTVEEVMENRDIFGRYNSSFGHIGPRSDFDLVPAPEDDETVPVKVADLKEWAHSFDNARSATRADQVRAYIPQPEQPVKVMLSELRALFDAPGLASHLLQLIARLEAENA
jgi:hypothetical protein